MTDADAPGAARARGEEAERRGDVDDALRAYASAGLLAEAVQLLQAHKRDLDAGELIMRTIARRAQPNKAQDRPWALKAADMFSAGGAPLRAAEVYAWLGSYDAGLALVERLLDKNQVFDAGASLVRLGHHQRATEVLVRVPRGTAAYIPACLEVARALTRGATLSMDLDRWLADFIRRGPASDAEAEGLYAIASAFNRDGMTENAVECLQRIAQSKPGFRDAAQLAAKLEAGARMAVEDFARVLDEDARFRAHPAQNTPLDDDRSPTMVRAPSLPAEAPVASLPSGAVQTNDLQASGGFLRDAFAPGVVLMQRYRLDELIGHGGMSIVFRATDLELQHVVALKVFSQPANDEALARFKQEVLLTRHVIHPNVIRVYDLGAAFGARFITMELLVGEDLHGKMSRGMTLSEGADLLIQACAGLEAAHQAGVIHRDIKPENLFVTSDGVVKVTDFGIAKHQDRPAGLTIAGMVVGTPEYMAPEQAHGHRPVTSQADLYSLGIILYFLCAGVLPFMHTEVVPLLLMQVNQAPEPPRHRNPALPREVEELVLQLLDKDPAKRPPSARALGERLMDLRRRRVI